MDSCPRRLRKFSQSHEDGAQRLARGLRRVEHGGVGNDRQQPSGPSSETIRLTVPEAADALGVTPDAIRGRIRRGTLASEREAGVVYVFVDSEAADRPRPSRPSSDRAELLGELRDRVAFLERELERKDAILLNMTEAMKALNPPPEPRESPVSATEQPGREEPQAPIEEPQEAPTEPRRTWWGRIFGY